MRDRKFVFFRRLTGDGDDLGHLLRGEGGGASRSRRVIEDLLHQLDEVFVDQALLLGSGQPVLVLRPPRSPTTHPLAVDTEAAGLLLVAELFRGHQHDLAPFPESMRGRHCIADPLLQKPALAGGHVDGGCFGRLTGHDLDSMILLHERRKRARCDSSHGHLVFAIALLRGGQP